MGECFDEVMEVVGVLRAQGVQPDVVEVDPWDFTYLAGEFVPPECRFVGDIVNIYLKGEDFHMRPGPAQPGGFTITPKVP